MDMEIKTKNMGKFIKLLNEGKENTKKHFSDDDRLIKEIVEHLKKGYDKKNSKFNEQKYTNRCDDTIPLELFRLITMVMMKKIKELGSELTLYDIGYEFGKYLSPKNHEELNNFFINNKLGILSIHSKNPHIVKSEDCALCDGLISDEPICHFDAGLIAGAYECILNKVVVVDEIKCMAKGDDACYFQLFVINSEEEL